MNNAARIFLNFPVVFFQESHARQYIKIQKLESQATRLTAYIYNGTLDFNLVLKLWKNPSSTDSG